LGTLLHELLCLASIIADAEAGKRWLSQHVFASAMRALFCLFGVERLKAVSLLYVFVV
jgi:hypothetical protein